ncbi:MAG: hypothetical protein EHM42_05800, partial [Planctomycetaceae bacterium]
MDMRADYLDRYARGNSACHRLSPRLKLLLTLAFIIAALCVPYSFWPMHGCLGCVALSALVLAEVPPLYVLRRIGLLLPPVLGLALSAPISRGLTGGWELAWGIVFRSVLTFSAGLWLVNTTPFESILKALADLGLPRLFIELLAFMYRYTFVVFDELARMRTAQRSRTFGRQGIVRSWISGAQLVG